MNEQMNEIFVSAYDHTSGISLGASGLLFKNLDIGTPFLK